MEHAIISSDKDTTLQEVRDRIEDIEVEHDMILGLEQHQGGSQTNIVGATFEKLISPKTPEICLQMPDPGPCTENILRWYYLSKEDDCFQFPWGGCAGNNNRFVTLDQCLATCQASSISHDDGYGPRMTRANLNDDEQQQRAAKISRCQHPPEAGP